MTNKNKYRVWDIDNKRMFHEALELTSSGISTWFTFEEHSSSNLIWSQITTLKDKAGEGNDVFDGDIFEVMFSNVPNGFSAMNFKEKQQKLIGIVVFKFGAYKLKVFHPEHKQIVYTNLSEFLKNEEKVVIGNIFENPELLKGSKLSEDEGK